MKQFTAGCAVALALGTALAAFGQSRPVATDPRLDLFLNVLRPGPPAAAGGAANPIPQSRLEQALRMLPAVSLGHGSGAPLGRSPHPGDAALPDPSIYGFCYEACRTERAVGSCGTPGPGASRPPEQDCAAIDAGPALKSIIGTPLGTGSSPFVDDNTGPDGAQPAGYTFLGQFIDHDVTRTTAALSAAAELSRRARDEAPTRARLAAAGITPDRLAAAIADAANPGSALSANTGKLDLDSVYGVADFAALGGIAAPWFEQRHGAYTGRFAQSEVKAPTSPAAPLVIDGMDYQRSPAGTAQIPDPRNSEHKILSQVQNLFEMAHNDCVDHMLAGSGKPGRQQVAAAFDACHQKVVWTYETIVATDFLPRISTEKTLARIAPGALHAYVRGTRATSLLPAAAAVHTFLYSCTPAAGSAAVIHIPHEFAVAAFRLGHSLVRDDYVLHDPVYDAGGHQLTGQRRPIFAAAGEPETLGLVGDNPVQPGDVIDWSYFFDVTGETAQAARPLDTLISDRLFSLPVAALPPGPAADGHDTPTQRNLPRRNILRAANPTPRFTGAVGLATGEEMERYAQQRIPGLNDATEQVRRLLKARLKGAGFDADALAATPLWLFVLAEAETTEGGQRLGELGSHIVDEFLLGSLRCDQGSVLNADPADLEGWGPTEAIARDHRYSMPDLIRYLQANATFNGRPMHLFGR